MAAFIVTTGKSIKIDLNGYTRLERSCESPGVVRVWDREGQSILLPANEGEHETFIAAYRRACEEDVPYRKSEVESSLLPAEKDRERA